MGADTAGGRPLLGPADARNLFDLEREASARLDPEAARYLSGGADDDGTVRANRDAFRRVGLRPRCLVDVRQVDTSLDLLGRRLSSPILLAPVGYQELFHPGGEVASARAAAQAGHAMIVSSLSSFPVGEVTATGVEGWFQLYPTPDRAITRSLLARAEAAGCPVVALTVDTPEIGNRESHAGRLQAMLAGGHARMGNFEGLPPYESVTDAGMTWEMVGWLKKNTRMKVILKGIATSEDAELALRHDADGLIVSNHGGRQLDGGRGSLSCLPEVVATVDGRIPVLLDGGIRRGTDVIKALAWGAAAVCIGRPYCWGLAAFGEAGVGRALELLQAELVLDMKLAGVTSLPAIHAGLTATKE